MHHVYFRLKKQRGKNGGSSSQKERRKGGKKRREFVWRRNDRWESLCLSLEILSQACFWDCFWGNSVGRDHRVCPAPTISSIWSSGLWPAQLWVSPEDGNSQLRLFPLSCQLEAAGQKVKGSNSSNRFCKCCVKLYDFILILCICMCFPIKDSWAVHMLAGVTQKNRYCSVEMLLLNTFH